MVLFKMLNRGIFNDINGCISTGKEVSIAFLNVFFFFLIQKKLVLIHFWFLYLLQQANVYHATRSDGQELAIKVYKTSVLVFKYVSILVRLHQLMFSCPSL